ncbi:MAG TPA: hypothetical protein VE987_09780 [Polyangiaceae bacterium]|nr:hypothetical protein [Polyangiaceae bacterium]
MMRSFAPASIALAAPLLLACGSGAYSPAGAGPDGSAAPGADAGGFEPVVPFDGGPTDIPITVAPTTIAGMPAGFRLAVQVVLGDAGPLQAFLDTGSIGIQALESALPADALAAIELGSTPIRSVFESGVTASGVIGKAVVTLGDRTTPGPIPIVVYQSFTCQPGSGCAQGDAGPPPSGDLFGGYPVIVGAGLRNGSASSAPGLGSPIPQLPGQPSFIVKAPSFGGTAGTLRLGPSADEVRAFSTIQLARFAPGAPLANGTPAWDDTGIPACVDDQASASNYCASAVLDTGSPLTAVFVTGHFGQEVLPPGDDVTVSIGPTSAPVEQFDVTVGATPQLGLDVFVIVPPVVGAPGSINLGLTVFFRYDVYFDPVHGTVGLLPH